MRIKSEKDFYSGLVFIVMGIAFAIGATNYNVGTAARMGPGYFPLMLGILLVVLGVAVTFFSLVKETPTGDKVGAIAWKPLGFIILANFLFGLMLGGVRQIGLPSFGIMVAIVVLTFVSAKAGDEFKFKEVAILATVLAVISYVAFIWALKLQFPVWPAFLVR